ncbi:hypothetical protein TWF481_000355 [Arthrobotrys musiformis]|uniref:Uncharacterized protein n=1 Tax=Arthrobotrys musiformis TaxID=47236 RepID=A0AAV9WP60_9PEZI
MSGESIPAREGPGLPRHDPDQSPRSVIRQQDIATLKALSFDDIDLEGIKAVYAKILKDVEDDTHHDRNEDTMEVDDKENVEHEYTRSEIDKLLLPAQNEIIEALQNEGNEFEENNLDPQIDLLLDELRNKKKPLEAVPEVSSEAEKEYIPEKTKYPSTAAVGLRAGHHAPFWIPPPLYPDFMGAFHTLPLDVAAVVLLHFIRSRWRRHHVNSGRQTWYQLIRILRSAEAHPVFKTINRPLRLALPVTSPLERLLSYAACRNNYWDARGVASADQAKENAKTGVYVGRLCRSIMSAAGTSVACPFCGVNNPSAAQHVHMEFRLVVKLFFQRQYRYVDPIILWDARTPEARAIFTVFNRWIYRWKSDLVANETRAVSNKVARTIDLANASRANTVFNVLGRWMNCFQLNNEVWHNNNLGVINTNWNLYRGSDEIYMGFPVAGPTRGARTVSHRRIEGWAGEDGFEKIINDQLVEVFGSDVEVVRRNQESMGIRGRRVVGVYEGLRGMVLPAQHLPPQNLVFGYAYRTEERWHHFYSRYPLDPTVGGSLAG